MTTKMHIRRVPLLLAILLLALMLCPVSSFATEVTWSRDDAAHLLRRAGFGGTPSEIDRVHAFGRNAAVDYLVYGKLPQGSSAPFAHAELAPFVVDPAVQYVVQGPQAQFELQKMKVWWIDRMVRTDQPLDEKMSLFWHGLFTSGYREVRNVHWLADQNALFHREAIGNYKRLTREVIHDPAMLHYLNNDENLKGRPNENLARELMELFTMGEGNGYTEKDIPEVARALTGMTARRRQNAAEFNARQHDEGPKTIFGKTGNYGPDDVVDLIFDRPEPAAYLAKRLWQFFGTPEPAAQDIAPVAAALKSSNWDLAPALRVLFTSDAFYGSRCKHVIIRSPVELEVATLRLLEEPPQTRMLAASVAAMNPLGQQLFQPPNVKGWPGGEHWITSGAVFLRYNIASAMASGTLGTNFGGRFGANNPAKSAKLLSSATTRPATQPLDKSGVTAVLSGKEERQARIQAARAIERDRVVAEIAKIPPLPSADELVVPSKLFAEVGKEPSAGQLVDSAVARFIQQPMNSEKKATLIESLGKQPLKLGEPESDRRVRQMIGLLLSTPEFQVE